jgi:curved DNA-binding protein CbpA
MNDPYEVLGLDSTADEAAIRRRYLELVRESPPDRAPERFAAIRAAFDEVRDPARRLQSLVLGWTTTDSLDAIATDVRARLEAERLPLDVLLRLSNLS